MGRLDGKVCFVTGAGSGIGAKTAELFAHEGASVIMADMHEENLNKVAANIRAAGGEVMTAVVNITDNDAVKAAFAAGVESTERSTRWPISQVCSMSPCGRSTIFLPAISTRP